MSVSKNPLVQFWAEHEGLGFHRCDLDLIKKHQVVSWTLQDALTEKNYWDPEKDDETKIHKNLIPAPYRGNLEKAKLYVLSTNPGFRLGNYVEDHQNKEHIEMRRKVLRQEIDRFVDLDVQRVQSGGGRYWKDKFAKPVKTLAEVKGIPNHEVVSRISPLIAIIELCPYHSEKAPGGWAFELPSAKAAKNYVHETLLPRATANEEILLVCIRSAKKWGLEGITNKKCLQIRGSSHRNPFFLMDEQRAITDFLKHLI